MALVLDTGVLYAALNRTEPAHLACRDLIESTDEEIVIPSPVLPEVDYFITTHMHTGVLLTVLRDIQIGNFQVVSLDTDDYFRVDEIVTQYADSKVGFVDAAVLAIVERLNEPKLATLDRRHFAMMRPRHVEALTLLPE
jgi:predicted nucleic acid-binding protein